HSAASMLCLWDPNIDVARCGWEIGIESNSRYKVRLKSHLQDVWLTLNMTRFHVSLRANGASVAINRQGIPIRLIASLCSQ
ncbi:MAG: hypothetical protein K2N20_06635, partial [Helicobacter sp.]|nr:hypothetical protein [Helicobacter sp.]